MKIAVCDDSRRDRKTLIGLLREYEQSKGIGFDIEEYDSGEALLKNTAALQDCRIIFMDINMEQVSGLEAAGQIKSLHPGVRIVLVTAFMNYVLEGYKVKASRFLVKDDLPITITECMDALVEEIGQEIQIMEFPFVEGNIRLRAFWSTCAISEKSVVM